MPETIQWLSAKERGLEKNGLIQIEDLITSNVVAETVPTGFSISF